MSRRVAPLYVLAWTLAAGAPAPARAQASESPFAEGVRAYKNLDFGRAAGLLRRDLARLTAARAPAAERAPGFVYLGAADLFRGQRDSAVAVFRRLVLLDPRFRPDQLVFPPEVTSVFDSVRARTKAVAITVPRDTEVAPGASSFGAWLFASSFQTVEVTLRYEDGAPFRSLYAGPIGDSLRVQWDGLDAAGELPPVSRVLLRVASRGPTGELAGIVQLPLDLRIVRRDTLPWPSPPADSQFLPERAGGRSAQRALVGGMLLAGAVAGLPAVVGGSGTSSGPRIAVAGSIGFAGVLGYILHRPGRPLSPNIRANQERRNGWQKHVDAVIAENAQRRGDVRVAVHAGDASAMQPRAP